MHKALHNLGHCTGRAFNAKAYDSFEASLGTARFRFCSGRQRAIVQASGSGWAFRYRVVLGCPGYYCRGRTQPCNPYCESVAPSSCSYDLQNRFHPRCLLALGKYHLRLQVAAGQVGEDVLIAYCRRTFQPGNARSRPHPEISRSLLSRQL